MMLQQFFSDDPAHRHFAQRCAILSTHTLSQIRYKAIDQQLWRNTRSSSYWEKDVWIIPIHRPRQVHWVLAVAYVRNGEIHLYDSFTGRNEWKKDVPVTFYRLHRFIFKLRFLTRHIGHLPPRDPTYPNGQKSRTPSRYPFNRMDCETSNCKSLL